MPHKKPVSNPVIESLLVQQKRADRAMSRIVPIPRGTYKDRDEYYGADSKYRYRPSPKTRMPGSSPPDKRRTILDPILEFLQIKPKERIRKNRPVRKSSQDEIAKGFI